MGLTTGDLPDLHLSEGHDQLGLRLVGAAIFIFRHRSCVGVAKLSAAATSPGVETALVCQGDRVSVTTGDLDNFNGLKEINKTGCRLVRIPFNICW